MNITPMTIEIAVADAIDQSVRNTFQTMLGTDVVNISHAANNVFAATDCDAIGCDSERILSIEMSWTGGLIGLLTLVVDKHSADLWANALLSGRECGERQLVCREDRDDCVREITNLIVGGAKTRLEDFNLTMTLPIVRYVKPESVDSIATSADIQIAYQAGSTEFALLASICERY
ncbi:MAG: chemotaxis protein CheX [Rhodopirellula sp. JB053]|uniref:chemotaxis protein CheX n=1 Tax=Rhodopirellula sp. JB044 TaxID=3342844 RepID=UPI00370BFA13